MLSNQVRCRPVAMILASRSRKRRLPCSYMTQWEALSEIPKKLALKPLYNPRGPSFLSVLTAQSQALRYSRPRPSAACALSSCSLVLITQIGLVAVPVTIPAEVAAPRWTHQASWPLLNQLLISRLPLPYTKKLMERAGTTATRFGPRPLNRARAPSTRGMAKRIWNVSRI